MLCSPDYAMNRPNMMHSTQLAATQKHENQLEKQLMKAVGSGDGAATRPWRGRETLTHTQNVFDRKLSL